MQSLLGHAFLCRAIRFIKLKIYIVSKVLIIDDKPRIALLFLIFRNEPGGTADVK